MAGKQHVQEYRKYLLRKRLLRWALPGAAYVPFIGDGDLATALYADRRVYGADIDKGRVRTAISRLPQSAVIIEADCDGWPFDGLSDKLAIADFDAYNNPYLGFRAFWDEAEKADRLVLFFTDGIRQSVTRSGVWTRFDGHREDVAGRLSRQRQIYNSYFSKHLWPYFEAYVRPWRVLERMRYLRGHMCYWGTVIECQPRRSSRPSRRRSRASTSTT